MAAVVLKEGREFDGVDACRVVANYLPGYARPRFIRIQVSHVYNPRLLIALLSVFLCIKFKFFIKAHFSYRVLWNSQELSR